MTPVSQRTPSGDTVKPTEPANVATVPDPTDQRVRVAATRVDLQVNYPDARSVVISVRGELDATTTSRLQELLSPRLSAKVDTVVIDMSRVDFVGVVALELLVGARLQAQQRGVALRLITGPAAVDRALQAACRVTGTAGFDTYPDHHTALSEAAGARTLIA